VKEEEEKKGKEEEEEEVSVEDQAREWPWTSV
jgi:hypothetical protein